MDLIQRNIDCHSLYTWIYQSIHHLITSLYDHSIINWYGIICLQCFWIKIEFWYFFWIHDYYFYSSLFRILEYYNLSIYGINGQLVAIDILCDGSSVWQFHSSQIIHCHPHLQLRLIFHWGWKETRRQDQKNYISINDQSTKNFLK